MSVISRLTRICRSYLHSLSGSLHTLTHVAGDVKNEKINVTDFYEISIRGRVAYSMCCLDSAINKFGYKNLNWDFLLNIFWEYTSIQYIDNWYYKVAEFIPDTILSYEHHDSNDFEYATEEEFNKCKNLYNEINEVTRRIIYHTFYIGTSELYGQAMKNGRSLHHLKMVVDLMKKNNISLPDISNFQKFEFGKSGWGEHLNREDVLQ